MRSIKISIYIIIFILFSQLKQASAQVNSDTLSISQQFRHKKEYKKASDILRIYHIDHPKDVNALWLLAQTEYWMGHLKTSTELYEKSVKLKPDDDYLQIDYSKVLADAGEWDKAISILKKMEIRGNNYSDGELIRAKISYWKGDYNTSKKEVDDVLYRDGMNNAAVDLRKAILLAKSPWVEFGASYMKDNQPLQNIIPFLKAGIYLNKYASLHLDYLSPIFKVDGKTNSSHWISGGNTINLSETKLVINVDAGIVRFPDQTSYDWSGNLSLKKKFLKYLSFEIQAEHRPYFYTQSSIDTNISVYHFTTSIEWNYKNYFSGKTGYDLNHFPDKNNVYTIFGWFYLPSIVLSKAEIKIGYGYSYSDSKESSYTSKSTLSDIIAGYSTNQTVDGIYKPYFTPKQQIIHSALISVSTHPSKKISIGANANIGFTAKTQTPYLFLDKDDADQTIIETGYSPESYTPYDISFFAGYLLTDKINLLAHYIYRSTYFYNSNYADVSLRISFWNEKK